MSAPTVPFKQRVHEAVANHALHSALYRATDRFGGLRETMLATLPDSEAARDQARLIRRHTMANLDRYLAEFVANCESAGGHVHWAADAEEANRIVVDLATRWGVQLVVKGKSMISEETELNHALAAVGVTPAETDLGEFVAQLGGEPPAHIVVPIVHKTRHDVSRLFHEKLGVAETEDVGQLTQIARETLRKKFLAAGMGFTGVNFGVAETGTIAVVSNEGNGRMCSSLPRYHVAMMGIERLVPTLSDLALMLQLLGRSATGQKLTAYNSLITGPRRPGDPDGPEELHVILVNNGRTRILASEYAEMLTCIRCGACLNACPVYRLIGGHGYGSTYPGPMGSVLSPLFSGFEHYADLPHATSLCGACREVCPVRIDLPDLLLRLRRDTVREGYRPWWLKLGLTGYAFAVQRPAVFRLAAKLGALATRTLGRGGWLRWLPPPLDAWTGKRDFPALAPTTFQARWKQRHAKPAGRGRPESV
jgi:L-lactate dehydrogenase complex protein LldF